MDEKDEKVLRLIEEVTRKLPEKVRDFFIKINVKYDRFHNDGFYFHHMHGCVSPYNPDIVHLNFFNIFELSDSAIMGVITHELGHVYTLHGKDFYYNFMIKVLPKSHKKKFEERRADKLAIKWGFNKELNDLRSEGVFYNGTIVNDGKINIYDEDKKINQNEKRVNIFLRCEKCKHDYKIEYYYITLTQTKIFFIKNKVSKAEITMDFPKHYKEIIDDARCIDCNEKLKVIEIIKNPPLY